MDRRTLIVSGLAAMGAAGGAGAQPAGQGPGPGPAYGAGSPPPPSPSASANPSYPTGQAETYSRDELVNTVSDFMGVTAEAAGGAIERVFKDNGRPTAYIAGEEASGAFFGGARYGRGLLYMKNRPPIEVFWQGPSVGWDFGGNASRVFTLCYNLQYPEVIFQRFPGVEGSAYLVAGLGVNYLRSDEVTLAPIRAGVGIRLGANVGYLGFSRHRRTLPF
ncbi:DUF1134 domain-containing protein [Phenylobacterium sp.]|jgi:hypothetical protein|uniref:DUF1134 domain-containing protein n=1 Tax=Phenylobacterium sp. TaxID=1871053 RepID=UPI0035B03045